VAVALTLQLTIFNRRWENMPARCRQARFNGKSELSKKTKMVMVAVRIDFAVGDRPV
jgi:hypothetical protein